MDPPPPPAAAADLLSSLPEHLQDDILTRLDLRDTLRTSAISRAWRRRWDTLPGLALSFPVLKELYLKCVDFGESHLQAIIRASPMLRVLLLENVYLDADMDCVIEAPNLHNLTLISCTDDWRFGELPHLQCACINVPYYLWGGTADFVECLTGVSQARELILYLPTLCDFKMDAIPFTISNLNSMELSTDFADMHCILLMFCLLRSSPNHEKLKIELLRSEMVANRKFLNAQWTDGMCANLKVVQINSYKGLASIFFHRAYSFSSKSSSYIVCGCMPSFSGQPTQ